MESKAKEAASQLTIEEAKEKSGYALIEYTSEDLGICYVKGFAPLSETSIFFDSWKPEENRELNSHIIQQKEPCTFTVMATSDDTIADTGVSLGCREACGAMLPTKRRALPSDDPPKTSLR